MKSTSTQQLGMTGFAQIALYWIGLIWIGFVMALANNFVVGLALLYIVLPVIWLLFAPARLTQTLTHSLRPLVLPTAIILTIAIVAGYFATPTVFTGRDQGSIATAAIMLADSGMREVVTTESTAFATHYGAGKALNFPGFFYTADGALTSGFPLPYTAYLAIFYSIFGTAGFIIANVILITLFVLAFHLLAQVLLRKITPDTPFWLRALPILATLATFPFLWFMKFTLTENLALFLIWTLILATIQCIRRPRTLWYITLLATGSLLALTRIEGIALLGIALLVIVVAPTTNRYIRANVTVRLFIPLLAFATLFGIVFGSSLDFYKVVIKGFIGHVPATTDALTTSANNASWFAQFLAPYTSYLSYGLLPWIIVGTASVALIWRRRKMFKDNDYWLLLLPALIILPTLIYLINPQISSDAPWMLRRLSFAIVPAGILYSVLVIAILHRRHHIVAGAIATALIAMAIPATLIFITYSPHDTLLTQTAKFASQFTPRDLILIDSSATGDGFAMMPGPLRTLYNIHSAYFFNPDDLTRVSFAQFDTVFLLIPTDKVVQFQDGLSPTITLTLVDTVTFTTTKLTPPTNPLFHFAQKTPITTSNTLFKVNFQSSILAQ